MPRPVAADAEATRRRILERAASLFSAQGVGSTSMRQIARGADVSQSTIHHYFGSKDGLYAACIEAMYSALSQLEERLFAKVAGASNIGELLEMVVREAYRFARAHRPAVRLMTRNVLNEGEGAHGERSAHIELLLERGAALLAGVSALDEASLRFALYSLTFMGVRLVLVEQEELARVLGSAGDEAVEAHLIGAARRLLGVAG